MIIKGIKRMKNPASKIKKPTKKINGKYQSIFLKYLFPMQKGRIMIPMCDNKIAHQTRVSIKDVS